MTEPSAAAGVSPYRWPIGALLIMLQLANSMRAVQYSGFGKHDGSTARFGHNMIKGLKLQKVPDMDKVCVFIVFHTRFFRPTTS
jgi:hypothetical protein